jgi:hypothetical protein
MKLQPNKQLVATRAGESPVLAAQLQRWTADGSNT